MAKTRTRTRRRRGATPTPQAPAMVIRRESEDRNFQDTASVNQFATNAFKAADRGAAR